MSVRRLVQAVKEIRTSGDEISNQVDLDSPNSNSEDGCLSPLSKERLSPKDRDSSQSMPRDRMIEQRQAFLQSMDGLSSQRPAIKGSGTLQPDEDEMSASGDSASCSAMHRDSPLCGQSCSDAPQRKIYDRSASRGGESTVRPASAGCAGSVHVRLRGSSPCLDINSSRTPAVSRSSPEETCKSLLPSSGDDTAAPPPAGVYVRRGSCSNDLQQRPASALPIRPHSARMRSASPEMCRGKAQRILSMAAEHAGTSTDTGAPPPPPAGIYVRRGSESATPRPRSAGLLSTSPEAVAATPPDAEPASPLPPPAGTYVRRGSECAAKPRSSLLVTPGGGGGGEAESCPSPPAPQPAARQGSYLRRASLSPDARIAPLAGVGADLVGRERSTSPEAPTERAVDGPMQPPAGLYVRRPPSASASERPAPLRMLQPSPPEEERRPWPPSPSSPPPPAGRGILQLSSVTPPSRRPPAAVDELWPAGSPTAGSPAAGSSSSGSPVAVSPAAVSPAAAFGEVRGRILNRRPSLGGAPPPT
jgi:hypothetical protein